jgi:hypothetical protein
MGKRVPLGCVAKDRITGFEGLVIGKHQYLTGCNKVTIQPMKLDKDGKPIESQWFDESTCEVTRSDHDEALLDLVDGRFDAVPSGGPDRMPREKL